MPILLLFVLAAVAAAASSTLPSKQKQRRKVIKSIREVTVPLSTPQSDDFPIPYAYADVLKLARRLVPPNLGAKWTAAEGSTADSPLQHSKALLGNMLVNNLARVEALSAPRWCRTVTLFYGVIWPYLASGASGRNRLNTHLSKGDPFAKELAGVALYSVGWLLGPLTAVVPKDRSLASAITDASFDASRPDAYKRASSEEQTQALFDLCYYLRTATKHFLAVEDEWWLIHQDAGGARAQAILDQTFHGVVGYHLPASKRLEGDLALVQEFIRYAVEQQAYVSAQLTAEHRTAVTMQDPELTQGILIAIGVAAAAMAAVTAGTSIAGVVAAGAAAGSAGAITATTTASIITEAITEAATFALGAELGPIVSAVLINVAQLAVIQLVGAGLLEMGLDSMMTDLGITVDPQVEAAIKQKRLAGSAKAVANVVGAFG